MPKTTVSSTSYLRVKYVSIENGELVISRHVAENRPATCVNEYCDKPALYSASADVSSAYCDECIHEECYSDGDI